MSPDLILGPLLRYAGETEATVWVETDAAREVGVRVDGSVHRSRTFDVEGHHYALVRVTGLKPGETYEYEVALDGEVVWPEPDSTYPPSVIRTVEPGGTLSLAFGSCRVARSHEPPHTYDGKGGDGYGRDALLALAVRMMRGPQGGYEGRPDALLLLGDQVYADEVSPETLDFIRSRRDTQTPPGETVADFEEYTRLYWEAWGDPVVRWLLSTVPTAMIFDDHDVHDDWNTSKAWVEEMRKQDWWEERIVGAFMSYWVYQHLGNLSPEELEGDELLEKVQSAPDPTRVLREFAHKADREIAGARWSFHRDFGKTRLIMMDSRAGRVLEEDHRAILDGEEWAWIEAQATGEFEHLVFGTSLPFLMAPGLHHLEAWNEAVCAGACGRPAARLGEKLRQAADLEHWAAFGTSFTALAELLRSVAAGERSNGEPPASVSVLSGDVHHGYLARMDFGDEVANNGAPRSPVYQAASSPLRNPLSLPERLGMRFGWSGPGERLGKILTRLAGVAEPEARWSLLHKRPWFDNHVSTLTLRGRRASLKVEKPFSEDGGEPRLDTVLERWLTVDDPKAEA